MKVVLLLFALLALFVIIIVFACIAMYLYRKAVDINPYKEEVENFKQRLVSLSANEKDIETELENLRNEKAQALDTIAKAEIERKWLTENEDTITHLKAIIAEMKEEARKLTQEKEYARDELLKVTEDLKEKNDELIEAEQKLTIIHLQKTADESEIAKLKQAIKLEKENEKNAIRAAQEATAKLLELQAKVTSEENKLKNLKDIIQKEIEEAQKSLQKKEDEIESLKSDIKNLKNEAKELNGEIKALTKEKSGLDIAIAERNPDINRWEDLEKPVIDYNSDKEDNIADEEEWLEEFKENLKKHDILFDDRIINAFHTSLKVADISPLVVLAGISGTGKSLLPQLYAKACGMNFIQLAVQPRWDSPQDMLGFYNYTEGRFKATELSRLLWQYDEYNNEKYDDSMPMNIVLLDEMNLAKVEYYFSDMLSKLEVRRTINPDDPDSRRAAEIEIECGATLADEQLRRLFVNTNTLFVGTMNEDETTQTLSDKVMDRANVLRFGRPTKIDAKPDINGFNEDAGDLVMPQEYWAEWVISNAKTKNNKGHQQLLKVMGEINELLTKVSRPFAHRVWQAMSHYVDNYPDQSSQGINNAIADQIELKILPKLKGLEIASGDVQDVLNGIGAQINELKDEKLSEAFEKAQKDTNSIFFQWHGVMR